MIIAIGLDGVIAERRSTAEHTPVRPVAGAIEGISQLKTCGHRIIICTERDWSHYEATKEWLQANDIPHDELLMGQPVVDRHIGERAIAFVSWNSVLDIMVPQNPTADILSEQSLRVIRATAADLIRQIAGRPDLNGPVLDVGPMWHGSGVFRKYPEFYVDAKVLIESRGLAYETVDILPDGSPTYVGDFTKGCDFLPHGKYGAVILNHCIEHMPRLFEVPRVLDHILAPGGLAFFATPWNFRFHGPRPDCWRISDDGYEALIALAPSLELVEVTKNQLPMQPLHPASIHCVVRKK